MSSPVGSDDKQLHQMARERAYRRYPHITKQLLDDLYYQQRLSTVEISRHLGVSRNVIWEYMEMHGLERRKPGQAGAMKSRFHVINEHFFSAIDTDDKAYIAGFVLGDGTLNNRRRSKRLIIALGEKDTALLEAIAERLGDRTIVKHRSAQSANEQGKAVLMVNSTKLVDDLVAAGIPLSPKSGHEPFIEFSTLRLTWNFIRGVFDADGHIRVYQRSGVTKGKLYGPYRRAKWSITCGIPFVSGLRSFLCRHDIALSPKCIQPKQGTGLIEVSDQDVIQAIGSEMYRCGTLWLQRKKDIFDLLG